MKRHEEKDERREKKMNHEGAKPRRMARRRIHNFFFVPASWLGGVVVHLFFLAGIAAVAEERPFFLERKK